ncbi:uncharacterized protein C8Q71DRAFT_722314 [Rhodofomes roseus]|uniref:F-box domain-containing protein n=1 Tax=Rhodofomes roseus TaxID=34475 RepID=A0ABQ8KM22_9APHY|nr:uncharacterized protein C8Q71DRAFT_722314 [Rhodofomes roseus]KAH9839372.1 hypothetical protein C8Q71DRAFT_722314 [Rhodofomes roseus]
MDYCDLPIAALVSRAWYARSTHNLYYVVHIKSRKSFNSLVEQSRRSPRVKQMLTTTHQLLVAHEDRRSQQKPFLDALPLVFSNALPLLEILTINAALRPSMHPTFFLALSHFERLVTLELYRVELCNITELRRIVRAFPRLEELGLDSVTMMQAYPPNNGSPHLARPSSCLQSSIKLQRLQIGGSSGSHNLLANVALREVTLALYAINDPEDPQDGWQSMADKLRVTLSTVRSHRLEHITVNFWVDLILPDHYLRKGWLERTQKQFTADMHSLHEVMARPYFDALKSVDVRIDAKYVLRRLPLSSEQRIRETARELVVPSFRNWLLNGSNETQPTPELSRRYTRAVLVYMIGGHVQYEATYLKESTFLSHKHVMQRASGSCPSSTQSINVQYAPC